MIIETDFLVEFPSSNGMHVFVRAVWMFFHPMVGRITHETKNYVTPPKFNSSPLKNCGWKTILSYWEDNFSGANC